MQVTVQDVGCLVVKEFPASLASEVSHLLLQLFVHNLMYIPFPEGRMKWFEGRGENAQL